MRNLKFMNGILVGTLIASQFGPLYSATEVSSEQLIVENLEDLEYITSENNSQINQSESNSEVISEQDSENLSEDSEILSEESQDVVAEESEVESEVTESEVTESDITESEQKAEIELVDDHFVQAITTSLTNYTGWKDNTKNGNGEKIYYKNGTKTKTYVYKNYKNTDAYWYDSEERLTTYKTYTYNKELKKNILRTERRYSTDGKVTSFKEWGVKGKIHRISTYSSPGKRSSTKQYYSSGILEKEYLYSNGKLNGFKHYGKKGKIYKESIYSKPGVLKSNIEYYSSGVVKEEYQYNSKKQITGRKVNAQSGKLLYDYVYTDGIKREQKQYRSNGKLEIHREYDSKGNHIKTTSYLKDGSYNRIIEYYTNKQRKTLTEYSGTNIKRNYQSWNSSGQLLKHERFGTAGKRYRYRTYYTSGQVKVLKDYNRGVLTTHYEYYSNGKYKLQNDYYDNGKLKTNQTYQSTGKRIYYKENYSNGRIKREYAQYYSSGKPQLRYDYTYYSNGTIKTKTRVDYSFKGEKSFIKSTYNSSGYKTAETVSAPSVGSYFKAPVRSGYITCQYRCYDGHTGVDFGNVNKTIAIYSTAPGTVVQTAGGCSATGGYLGNNCNYGAGNYVVIKHNYNGRQFFSIYMHLSAISVKEGQKVTASTKIGNMGNSGNSSGPHLHFDLFEDTDKDNLRNDEFRTNPAIFADISNIDVRIW